MRSIVQEMEGTRSELRSAKLFAVVTFKVKKNQGYDKTALWKAPILAASEIKQ